MSINKPVLKTISKHALQEIGGPPSTGEDVIGDEIIINAMAEDILGFVEGLPKDQRIQLLDTFMDILVQQHPELEDIPRG
jgi:hypothetical protein